MINMSNTHHHHPTIHRNHNYHHNYPNQLIPLPLPLPPSATLHRVTTNTITTNHQTTAHQSTLLTPSTHIPERPLRFNAIDELSSNFTQIHTLYPLFSHSTTTPSLHPLSHIHRLTPFPHILARIYTLNTFSYTSETMTCVTNPTAASQVVSIPTLTRDILKSKAFWQHCPEEDFDRETYEAGLQPYPELVDWFLFNETEVIPGRAEGYREELNERMKEYLLETRGAFAASQAMTARRLSFLGACAW